MAKLSSIIPSPRSPCPQVLQCHPHVPNNPTISLKPTSNRTSTGPRHDHPAHKYLRGIPAWQNRHLSSLRHGHSAHKYLSAIPTCRTIQQSPSNRPLTGPRPVFAKATLPTGTSVPSRRAEQSHNLSQTGLKPDLDRSSPRPPCPQVLQCHPGVAKLSSIIPSPRPPCPQISQCHPGVPKPSSIIPSPRPPCSQVPQWHPDVPNNHTISLKPASNRTSTGLRHGHPAHRYLSAISAWQNRHLSSLRHGHPAHRYSSAIPACRTITQSLSNRPLTGPRPVLATAILPTGTPVPSPRAETYQNRSLKDVPSGF